MVSLTDDATSKMKAFHFLSVPLLLILFLQNFSISAATLEETCKKIAVDDDFFDYDFCLTSLKADPKSRTANPKGLALIATKLSKTNFTSTKAKVKQLLQNRQLKPKERANLTDCSLQYAEGIHSINVAVSEIKSNNKQQALVHLSAALDSPVDCEDGFKELGIKSLLTIENANCAGLAAITAALTNSLG